MNNQFIVYTQEDVANILHTNEQTIASLRETNCLEFVKVGKRYLTSSKWIEQFFDRFGGADLSNYSKMIEEQNIRY